jgi:hypothetical protein
MRVHGCLQPWKQVDHIPWCAQRAAIKSDKCAVNNLVVIKTASIRISLLMGTPPPQNSRKLQRTSWPIPKSQALVPIFVLLSFLFVIYSNPKVKSPK